MSEVRPMQAEGPGSVTRCLLDLQAGDQAAARVLWDRYFLRLVGLVRARLRGARRSGEADEEDVVLSAFDSFYAGVAEGQYPDLAGRDELWRLLVVIAARKSAAQTRMRSRQKRGGGRVLAEADLHAAGSDEEVDMLDGVVGREPSPEFAALVAEEYGNLLDALGDESLRGVAVRRMEGYTTDEIAGQLGCARRTVARRLDLIRKTWLSRSP
jgi:DNA-directed RNA polymerase specialized sigma24 family protein